MGILCKHALMVFNSMHVTVLPNCYLLKRWMKNVKNRVNSSFQESDSVGGGHASEMVFVNQIMRSMYDLTQMSKSHDDARRKLHGMVETAKDEISNLVENLSVDDETSCDHIPTDGHMHEVCIRNPLTGKAKGVSNANITRHWDNKSRKGKGKGKGKGKESAEISSSKGAKRKDQSSQNAYNTGDDLYTITTRLKFPTVPKSVGMSSISSCLWAKSTFFPVPTSIGR
ncbi:uncharacterized protein [Primulina eburnea]|uniref:uncharacterized protein n=1 Tax=Primulina eburnea TaxID=1245227 RepID=UPI003C6C4E72